MYENIVPQGWQCPICKRVYSPSMPMCNYCGELKFTYSTNLAEIVNLDKKDYVRLEYTERARNLAFQKAIKQMENKE